MARPKKEIIKQLEPQAEEITLDFILDETKEDTTLDTEEPIKEENIFKVISLRENNLSIGTINIPSHAEVVITEEQMASEKTMKKLEHAIKIGLIKEV